MGRPPGSACGVGTAVIPRWLDTPARCCLPTRSGRMKVAYRSSLAADMAATWYSEHGGTAMYPYPCLRCGGWHLTSRSPDVHGSTRGILGATEAR